MKKKMKMPMSAVSPLNTLTCSSVSPFPGAGSSWACPSSWPPASAWKRHKNNLTSNSVIVGWILFSVPFRITHIQVRHQWRLKAVEFKPLLGAYKTFVPKGIFIVSHLIWQRTSVFAVSSEEPPHLVASNDKPVPFLTQLQKNMNESWFFLFDFWKNLPF